MKQAFEWYRSCPVIRAPYIEHSLLVYLFSRMFVISASNERSTLDQRTSATM